MLNKAFKWITLLTFFLIGIYALLNAGNFLVLRKPVHKADVMVVLMGSIPDRALSTIDAYRQKIPRRIWIVEENMMGLKELRKQGYIIFSNSSQMKSILSQAGIPDSPITIIPGYASSTLHEAQAVEKWLDEHRTDEIDTLVILSSASHMRRAYLIFNYILNIKGNHKLFLGTLPSDYSEYQASQWYSHKEEIQTTFSEYIKILSFYLYEKWAL